MALGLVLATVLSLPPRVDRALHRSIGAALAKQTTALLGTGGTIVVITRDTEAFPQPALGILLDSFQKEVRRASAKITSIQRLQVDPLRPAEVPAGDFAELLRRAPDGTVIVSLLGPPLLSEDQWARLRPLKAKIVAFCPGNAADTLDLRSLFESGCLHAAVVGRSFSQAARNAASSPPQTFDELYLTVTASDLSKLPARPASP